MTKIQFLNKLASLGRKSVPRLIVATPILIVCSTPAVFAASHAELIKAGEAAYHKHNMAEAEKNFDAALKEDEKADPNGLSIAETLTNLGVIYDSTGRFVQAEAAYKRSLTIREKLLGRSDMAVATTLNDLANLYKDEKKYKEAEEAYLRSIDISIEKEGQDSPLLAPAYYNLAQFYLAQNRDKEAIPLLKRSLAICDKTDPGSDHVMVCWVCLASIYDKSGQYAEAKQMFSRYFDISATILGLKPEDPKTITVLKSFAADQRKMNGTKLAEMMEKAIQYKTKPAH